MRTLRQEYREIFAVTGLIGSVVAFVFLIPAVVSVLYGESFSTTLGFLVPFLVLEAFSLPIYRIFHDTDASRLSYLQGAVSVVFTWIIMVFASTLPFIMILDFNFTQATFETVSGWTTTGLSVVDVLNTPNSLLIFRSIMQFFGGFGIVALMITSIVGVGTMSTLYETEGHDQVLPNIKKTAQTLFSFYVGIMLAGALAYILAGMPAFDAINHSMSALATGGFSVQPDSIGHYDSIPIEGVTIALMVLGSLNFATYILLLRKKYKVLFSINEHRFYLALMLIVISAGVFLLTQGGAYAFGTSFRVGLFETVTALTGTGYSIVDSYTVLPAAFILLSIMLMTIGGQSGSTTGGLKVTRVHLMVKTFKHTIVRSFQAERQVTDNVVTTPSGEKNIHRQDMVHIYNYVTVYIAILIIGTIILATQGFSVTESFFEYASALGTVGLSIGVTNAALSGVAYWSMTLGMFLGRLEFLVVFVVFVKLYRDTVTTIKSKVPSNDALQ
ncbi:MAG: TrkH family potassium uptake protein [Bacillota bacterium]